MSLHNGADDVPLAEQLGLTIDSSSFVPYYEQIVGHVRKGTDDPDVLLRFIAAACGRE